MNPCHIGGEEFTKKGFQILFFEFVCVREGWWVGELRGRGGGVYGVMGRGMKSEFLFCSVLQSSSLQNPHLFNRYLLSA